jgi:hypothetical protein
MHQKNMKKKKEKRGGKRRKREDSTVENMPAEKEICPYKFNTLHSTGL